MKHKSGHVKKSPARADFLSQEAKDALAIIRIVIGSMLFAISLIVSDFASWIRLLLFAMSALILGYDILLRAIGDIAHLRLVSTEIILSIVIITSFIIGFVVEGVAVVILYQISLPLMKYIRERSDKSALELISGQPQSVKSFIENSLELNDNTYSSLEASLLDSYKKVMTAALLFSVVYAVVLPFLTDFSYRVSIHRALMIILIVSTISIVSSIKPASSFGLCYSARSGFVFENAQAMEREAHAKVFIFDSDAFEEQYVPEVLNVSAVGFDTKSFLHLARNATFNSKQDFAQTIYAAATGELMLNLIDDFEDIPNLGLKLKIAGTDIELAQREYFNSINRTVPDSDNKEGKTFFLFVAQRYCGKISVSEGLTEDVSSIIAELRQNLGVRVVLLNTSDNSKGEEISEKLQIRDVIDTTEDGRFNTIQKIVDSMGSAVYVFSGPSGEHSPASVDILIGKRITCEDCILQPSSIMDIPFVYRICRRVYEVASSNALFVFTVKAILIFLSIIGYCNLWFAMFMDIVASIASILLSVRVLNESIFNRMTKEK